MARPRTAVNDVVARRIRERRKARGWTQAELAARLSYDDVTVAPSNVSAIEAVRPESRRAVGLDLLLRLAGALNCSVDYLLGMTDEPNPRDVDSEAVERMALIRELAAGTSLREVRKRLAEAE
jgi:transcriptional regulator with XRE-family HTH domain